MPLLQAEEDRDQVRRYWADRAREMELLGEETKVYHSDRYVQLPFAYIVGEGGRKVPLLFGLEEGVR